MQLKLYGFDNEPRPPGDAPQAEEGEDNEEIDQLFKSGKKKKKGEKSVAKIALLVENVMAELEVVAEEDAELNKLSKPAINKLKKLPLLMEVLSNEMYENYVCTDYVLHFMQFPIDLEHYDRREQLKKSGLAKEQLCILIFCVMHVIMFMSKYDEETAGNRRMAKHLVDKWVMFYIFWTFGTHTCIDHSSWFPFVLG
ncbi:hypothetical protein HYC85_023002 [Camellia sinensis]|uniref:Uncharacterized protein n=1 Tax=Camellia sinensis TaxID=4442 RepID=A0A7J7GD94_CAMSI|nr:hypothetical protein HYC85_023002 [Camellia sinensis]